MDVTQSTSPTLSSRTPFAATHRKAHQLCLCAQAIEEIVARCLEAGLVEGDNLRWMAAEANANKASRIPREQLAEQSQCVIVGVQATAARLTQETWQHKK